METIMQDISTGPVGEGEEIESGQCLSFLAFLQDIAWDTVWDHEDNDELRQTRLHPNILLPGDKVTIPPKTPVEASGQTVNQRHTFTCKTPAPTALNLRFTRFGEPRQGEDYLIKKDRVKITSGQLDEYGMLELTPIMPNWDTLKVFLGKAKELFEIKLGALPPVTEPRGIQARLWNLGYYQHELCDEITNATENAFKRFLHKNGLLPHLAESLNKDLVINGLVHLVSVHGS